MERGGCCKIQLINEDRVFNERGLQDFMSTTNILKCKGCYSIVAILGPQGSGKSTLMNHLFGTDFVEMDAYQGRTQTTKGIWIAKCSDIGTFTIAMDLEGTDSRERGEDDTAFEKQSSLFALAIADMVLINIWYHDIGREQAANNPLLKTVFQVMMRLSDPPKKTLLFVIRDRSPKTPLDRLAAILEEDIQKIWDGIAKPEAHKSAPLSNFFKVDYIGLPSYEAEEQQFKEQVAVIRQWISEDLSGDKPEVPPSGFSFSAQEIWKTIKENKDLNLPAHKVMVATVRCEEIANEKLKLLASDTVWLALEKDVQDRLVSGLGKKLNSILSTYISEYEKDAEHYDEVVRTAKLWHLKSTAFHVFHGAYDTNLGHLRTKTLDSFKTMLTQLLNEGQRLDEFSTCVESCMLEFVNGCEDAAIIEAKWDNSKIKARLLSDIQAHTLSILTTKMSELEANSQVAHDHRPPSRWPGVVGGTVAATIAGLIQLLTS